MTDSLFAFLSSIVVGILLIVVPISLALVTVSSVDRTSRQ